MRHQHPAAAATRNDGSGAEVAYQGATEGPTPGPGADRRVWGVAPRRQGLLRCQ